MMKRKSISILLVVLTLVVLTLSLSLSVFSIRPYWKKHGIPAYAITTREETEQPIHYVAKTDLKPWNIFLLFIVLSFPIFLSGYLWASAKDKNGRDL